MMLYTSKACRNGRKWSLGQAETSRRCQQSDLLQEEVTQGC